MTRIDVYPVGWLAALRFGVREVFGRRHPLSSGRPRPHGKLARSATHRIRIQWRHTVRHVRNRQWRDLKNEFNGYLAEPYDWPPGLTRCGTGWTRRRALRSLERRARQPGVAWEQLQPSIDRQLRR